MKFLSHGVHGASPWWKHLQPGGWPTPSEGQGLLCLGPFLTPRLPPWGWSPASFTCNEHPLLHNKLGNAHSCFPGSVSCSSNGRACGGGTGDLRLGVQLSEAWRTHRPATYNWHLKQGAFCWDWALCPWVCTPPGRPCRGCSRWETHPLVSEGQSVGKVESEGATARFPSASSSALIHAAFRENRRGQAGVPGPVIQSTLETQSQEPGGLSPSLQASAALMPGPDVCQPCA